MASDANSLATAAASGNTDFGPSHTYEAGCVFELTLNGETLPEAVVIPLRDTKLANWTVGRLTAVMGDLKITLPVIPGLDAQVVFAVVPAGVDARLITAETAPLLTNRELIVIRAGNTAINSEERVLKFQPGISRSLLGVQPGMYPAAIAASFTRPPGGKVGTKGTYSVYLSVPITVSGFGVVMPF